MTLQQDQQDITDAEVALQALGLSIEDLDQALKLLRKRKNAQEDIARIQQNQFHDDAFNLISQIHAVSASSDKIVAMSQFLRQFAEYIAGQTLVLQSTYTDAKTIVDHISPIGGNI